MAGGVKMKRCPKCNEQLEDVCFRKDASRKSGLDVWCKQCRREMRNPIKDKERKKRYLAKQPDRAYIKYKLNNPKKIKAQQLAKYRIQHREKCSIEGCV